MANARNETPTMASGPGKRRRLSHLQAPARTTGAAVKKAAADADMIATHWVEGSKIPALAALQDVLTNPNIVVADGFARLVNTALEIPAVWAKGLDLSDVVLALIRRCDPVAGGVALLMARRETPGGAPAWAKVRHLFGMPPSVSAALGSRRGDIQLFVATAWRAVALACGPSCWEWIAAATATPWIVVVGTPFAEDVARGIARLEIQTMPSPRASLAYHGNAGLKVLDGDLTLLLLYLLFGPPQYARSTPPLHAPPQIFAAAAPSWTAHLTTSS